MDEYTSPAAGRDADDGQPQRHRGHQRGRRPRTRSSSSGASGDRWLDVTCSEFLAEVHGVAKGLMAAGVGAGDRVGLMSKTRYEWTLIDFAIWTAGAVTVPIYETSSAEQVQWILSDSGAGRVPRRDRRSTWPSSTRSAATSPTLDNVWTHRRRRGRRADRRRHGDRPTRTLEDRRTAARPGDLATIIYTSGTTGRPKGCELTHGNFLFEAANVISAKDSDATLANVFQDEDASTLLFLPLAHVFARMIEVGVVMARGRARAHGRRQEPAGRPRDLPADVHPVGAAGVREGLQLLGAEGRGRRQGQDLPRRRRHRDRLQRGAATRAAPGSALQGQARRRSTSSSTASCAPRSAAGSAGRSPAARRSVTRLGHFYRGIGLTVLEGYGLTETTAASTVNTPGMIKIGTVGRPLPGVSVRIADDGEILVKGGQVFTGYYNNDDGHRRGARRRLVPHRRHRRARRRRLPAHHRPQEGAHRHRRRQERRAGRARGPAARAPAGQPVHGRRRRPALHRLPGHPRRGGPAGLARAARQAGDVARRGRRGPRRASPRSRRRSTTPTRRCRRPRRSRSSRSSRSTGPRRAARSRRRSSSSATSS